MPGLGFTPYLCSVGLLHLTHKQVYVSVCAHADVYLSCGVKSLHVDSPVVRFSLAVVSKGLAVC